MIAYCIYIEAGRAVALVEGASARLPIVTLMADSADLAVQKYLQACNV